jgi:hypothetical protein
MCYGCVCGEYKGLTIKTYETENEQNIDKESIKDENYNTKNFQNSDENSIKNIDDEIANKVCSILNLPYEHLVDDTKIELYTRFQNTSQIIVITNEKLKVDNEGFLLEPEKISNKLALFQNLDEFTIFDKDGLVSGLNHTYTYQDCALFFDGDCKIKKYVEIPQNIFKINIIPMNKNMRKTCVEDIYDYNFLPSHIEYIHFTGNYMRNNHMQTNLPTNLKTIKFSLGYNNRNCGDIFVREFTERSKIPFGCKIDYNRYY